MEKKYIQDKDGVQILPITHISAVRDDGGNTLDSILANDEQALLDESNRAKGAELTLLNNINAETTRATAAEGNLNSTKANKATTLAGYGVTDAYTKSETYNKTELNNLITTPNQQYVTVTATDQTTAATDVLPATGEDDTIYRVGNWDGTQYSEADYAEYAWDGSAYVLLSTKSQVGEVYDISANHSNQTYADLTAALGTDGANIPQSLQKGGMSVKYVQTSDNKYIQARLMANAFTTDVTQWQGVDDEPTAGSDNLVKSGELFSLLSISTGKGLTMRSKEDDKIILDSGTIVSNSNNTICYFNVEEGHNYRIVNDCNGSGYHQIVFLDNNGDVVGVMFNPSAQITDEKFICPVGATKIAVNNTSLWTGTFVAPAITEMALLSMQEVNNKLEGTANHISYFEPKEAANVSVGYFMNDYGTLISNSGYIVSIYNVQGVKNWKLSNRCAGSGFHHAYALDEDDNVIASYYSVGGTITDNVFTVHSKAVKIVVNTSNWGDGDFVHLMYGFSVITAENINGSFERLKGYIDQESTDVVDGKFMMPDGILVENSDYTISYYNTDGGLTFKITNICQGSGFTHLLALDGNNNVISTWQNAGGSITDYVFVTPTNVVKVVVNTSHWGGPFVAPSVRKWDIINGEDVISSLNTINGDITELDNRVDSLEGDIGELTVTKDNNMLYVRTAFDNTRDVVISWKINNANYQMSQINSWLGAKNLSLSAIIAQNPNHVLSDTVPPYCTHNYWFISGEHGYIIPLIQTDVTLPSDSIGSIWEDENNFQYKVYYIDGTKIYLMPLVVADGGGQGKDTRGWNIGQQMSSTLTHVSGGTYTSNLNVLSTGGYQFYTIFKQGYKKIVLDGNEITDNTTLKGNELKVIERFVCIDPKTINDFNNVNGNPLFECTRTYVFYKNTVTCRELFDVKDSIWGKDYGSQPMGLRVFGNYKPMIFIPKCKAFTYDGNTFDWKYPVDCSSPRSGIKEYFYNNTDDIETMNDMPDRVIEYHKDDQNNLFGIGFASGLSLINGITQKEERVENTNLAFNFSNDERNKVYFKGVMSSDGVFNENDCFEIVRYYSYFNPSDGDAFTYFYKENNKIVVYVHCFGLVNNGNIVLPIDFDGMEVQNTIEKTDNFNLLTTIVSGNVLKFKTTNSQYSYIVFVLK